MTRALVGLVAILSALAPVGCGGPPSPLPDDPDRLILYSLDGMNGEFDEDRLAEAKLKGEFLYGFPVLGKVEVTDPRQKREVLRAIRRAIGNPPMPSKCFWPRHAVRAVKGGET